MPFNALMESSIKATIVGILYFLGAWVGVNQTITPDGIAVIWPANAVILTALLLTQPREWPLIAVAILVAECIADLPLFPLWAAIGFGLINLLEAVLAASLIRRFAGSDFRFETLRHLTIFLLAAPLLASAVAAILGASIYELLDRTENTFLAFWKLWWMGDALGLLLLTPLLVSLWQARNTGARTIQWRKLAELIAIWAGIAITGFYLFARAPQEDVQFHVTTVLLVPFAVWAATRFGTLWTAVTVGLISVTTIAGATPGCGVLTAVCRMDHSRVPDCCQHRCFRTFRADRRDKASAHFAPTSETRNVGQQRCDLHCGHGTAGYAHHLG